MTPKDPPPTSSAIPDPPVTFSSTSQGSDQLGTFIEISVDVPEAYEGDSETGDDSEE